ncbi:hypothetical protein MRX96_007567 [Rhipicephalus microplus]
MALLGKSWGRFAVAALGPWRRLDSRETTKEERFMRKRGSEAAQRFARTTSDGVNISRGLLKNAPTLSGERYFTEKTGGRARPHRAKWLATHAGRDVWLRAKGVRVTGRGRQHRFPARVGSSTGRHIVVACPREAPQLASACRRVVGRRRAICMMAADRPTVECTLRL